MKTGRVVSEVERVLRKHYYFALDPSRCMGCGEHLPCDGEVDDEHRAHVAEQIEALIAERVRAAQAEAWDEGAHAGREYQKELLVGWSRIGPPPRQAPNPYRFAQDAPENAPTEQMRYDDGSWSRTIAPTAPRPDESGGA